MGSGKSKIQNYSEQLVERQDISGLTDVQQRAMQKAYDDIERARRLDDLDLAIYYHTHGAAENVGELKTNFRPVYAWQDYGRASKEEAFERELSEAKEQLTDRFYPKYVNNLRKGIVYMEESTHTVKALEKRGYIEVLELNGRYSDLVRIVEKNRRK